MKKLQGKRAIVTGAGSGIGRAISIALADQGTDLVLMDIDRRGLADTAEQAGERGVHALTLPCDLTSEDQIAGCADAIRRDGNPIDILINNAGIAYYGPTDEMTSEQWSDVLDVNLHAPIRMIQTFLPTLKSRTEAHILNVVSVGGLVAGSKMAAYNTTKFGLQGLSESLRAELAKYNIGVSAVCPGFTKTSIFDSGHNSQGNRGIRRPPEWVMTTPEIVARGAIKAIRRNQPLTVITPGARLLWLAKRMFPRTFLRILGMRFSRPKFAGQDDSVGQQETNMTSKAA